MGKVWTVVTDRVEIIESELGGKKREGVDK